MNGDNIIYECGQKHAVCITETESDKMYNSIVKIQNNINDLTGTGFFMKIHLNNKISKFLLTCHHVISKNLIDKKAIINISYGKLNQETKLKILLDKEKRFIKCFKQPIDVTFIEIFDNDKIADDKFLLVDYNFKNGYNFYDNKNIFSAGYPIDKEGDRCISSGEIKKIKEIKNFPELFEFEHSLDTNSGSSGSPICLSDNICVIGIHKASNKKEQ